MNPLEEYPAARKLLYLVQFIVSGVLLLIGVGFGAAGEALPTWYAVTTTVASALWTYLGLTAAQNAPATLKQAVTRPYRRRHE